ncbi:MAG: sugar phosphate isomerase/epimerase [Bacteroidales bacterium]
MKKNLYVIFMLSFAALMFAFSFSSCESKPKKEIGLQLWSVRDTIQKDLKGTIENIGKMGYSFIEAAGYNDGKFYDTDPAEFKALLETNHLVFLSSHTGQAVPDSANWNSVMEWWDKAIAAHKAAGVTYIVQPFMDSVGYTSIAGLKRYCDYFNAVGEKCNAAGIRFGYHNHDREFGKIDSVTIYDYMLKNTDPAKVFFQLDLYWIKVGGKNAVDYFNNYPGRFELWHVKDKTELGNNPTQDFKPIFEAAEKAGMKHYIVEVEEYNFTPIESVQKSFEYLDSLDYVK